MQACWKDSAAPVCRSIDDPPLIEGINSLVQAAKAKARGYRSVRNLIAMV